MACMRLYIPIASPWAHQLILEAASDTSNIIYTYVCTYTRQYHVENRTRRQSGFPTFISCQRQDANVLPKRRQSHQGDKLCDVSTVPLVARWPVFLARGSDADGEPHYHGCKRICTRANDIHACNRSCLWLKIRAMQACLKDQNRSAYASYTPVTDVGRGTKRRGFFQPPWIKTLAVCHEANHRRKASLQRSCESAMTNW